MSNLYPNKACIFIMSIHMILDSVMSNTRVEKESQQEQWSDHLDNLYLS